MIYKILLTSSIAFMLIQAYPAAAGTDRPDEDQKNNHSVAVVISRFDSVETLLKIYRIPYELLKYEDLEDENIFLKYSAIFFPCGIGSYVETNINILSRGTSVQGVFLKDNYREVDRDKICGNIKEFIDGGGSAYFSDYSYEFVPDADKVFQFFNNFPNTGMIGAMDIQLFDGLKIFCRRPALNGFAAHKSWIAVKKIKDADILASGSFKTVKGERYGPIAARLSIGNGEALYTAYHGSRDSEELKRYLLYRVSYKYLSDVLLDESRRWDQNVNGTIIDSVREWEICRIYPIPLSTGYNTIYFTADKGLFQMDLFDKDDNIIISKDVREKDFEIDINCYKGGYYLLSVYPSYPLGHSVYSIAISQGIRIIPYFKKMLYVLLFGLMFFIIFMIRKMLGIRRFSGRY